MGPRRLHYHSSGGIKCYRKISRIWTESYVLDLPQPPGYMKRSILAATCILSFVNKEGPTWLHVSYTISTGQQVSVYTD